jgi:hypothetical protein
MLADWPAEIVPEDQHDIYDVDVRQNKAVVDLV